MAEASIDQAEVAEEIQQHSATEAETNALGIEAATLLICILHVGRTSMGRAVGATVHTLAPDARVRRYSMPTSCSNGPLRAVQSATDRLGGPARYFLLEVALWFPP
ncbi:hypothetical protein ABT007_27925 [Streptomyces griseus]|uniref:hypothetical protein n=1 Tax=Streptomyces griseus TaxID=1911 RepID=UPI00332965A8